MTNAGQPRVIAVSYLRNLIIKCSLLFTVGILLTTVIFYFSVHQQPGASYEETFRILLQAKEEILTKSVIIYTFAFVIILTGIVIITLLYSHRVVGPMRRISRVAEKISAGDFSETITLRRNDAIQPLADELNDLIEAYRKTLSELILRVDEIKEESARAGAAGVGEGKGSTDRIAGKIKELEGLVGNIRV